MDEYVEEKAVASNTRRVKTEVQKVVFIILAPLFSTKEVRDTHVVRGGCWNLMSL